MSIVLGYTSSGGQDAFLVADDLGSGSKHKIQKINKFKANDFEVIFGVVGDTYISQYCEVIQSSQDFYGLAVRFDLKYFVGMIRHVRTNVQKIKKKDFDAYAAESEIKKALVEEYLNQNSGMLLLKKPANDLYRIEFGKFEKEPLIIPVERDSIFSLGWKDAILMKTNSLTAHEVRERIDEYIIEANKENSRIYGNIGGSYDAKNDCLRSCYTNFDEFLNSMYDEGPKRMDMPDCKC